MPKDVRNIFKQIFMKEGKMDEQSADNYFQNLQKRNKYQEEVWS